MNEPTKPTPRRTAFRITLLLGAFTLGGVATAAIVGHPPEDDNPLSLALRLAVTLFVVVPLIWFVCRSLGSAHLIIVGAHPIRRAPSSLLTAALTCWVAATLTVLAAVTSGAATVDGGAVGPAILSTLVLAPLILIAHILPEEVVFRGCLQYFLGFHLSRVVVLIMQAGLFALSSSLILGSTAEVLGFTLIGLYAGLLRQLSGDIWAPAGARLALVTSGVILSDIELAVVDNQAAWDVAISIVPALAAYFAIRAHAARQSDPTTEPGQVQRRQIPVRGILYDVGSRYIAGQCSRERWQPDVVREEMRVIREDLHCTTVNVFGGNLERLEEAARFALAQGLDVWIQPRSLDAGHEELVDHVARAARFAERLRQAHPNRPGEPARVVLSVGCEVTVLNRGIIPGRNMGHRAMWLMGFVLVSPYLNVRLNHLLRRCVEAARGEFRGPLTYGSGTWETVDWALFDIVGVDYYLDATTRGSYRQGLRGLARHGKPIVVTEFGSCTYVGAPAKGGGGGSVLRLSSTGDHRVRKGTVRSEQVQADHIEECLDVFETEDIHGAFACMFMEGDLRYSSDPTRDADMASLGIVSPPSHESGLSADDGHWEPKLAFHALARRFAFGAALRDDGISTE